MTVSDSAVQTGPHIGDQARQAPGAESQSAQRAGARESTSSTAQLGRTTTAEPEITLGNRIERLWMRWLGWVTPPDIWSTDRPSLAKVWAQATRGEWARPAGVTRWTGRLYAVLVALPVAAVCKYIEWVSECGSRLAAAVVLVAVLAQFPPISWLI